MESSVPIFGPITPIPLDQLLGGVPRKIRDLPLKSFNKGIFAKELVDLDVVPSTDPKVVAPSRENRQDPSGDIREGTYGGTQLALTELYERIESG